MKHSTLLAALSVVLATALAHGTSQQTGERSVRLAKEVYRLSVEARIMERQEQCLAAVAVQELCTCLSASLPLELNFVRYVALVSARPEQLKPGEIALQETAFAVRDRCISSASQQPAKR